MTYQHRVAFNCDLFLTLNTDSVESNLEELERLAVKKLRTLAVDNTLISEAGIGVMGTIVLGNDARLYPRCESRDGSPGCPADDAQVQLENFSIENVEASREIRRHPTTCKCGGHGTITLGDRNLPCPGGRVTA